MVANMVVYQGDIFYCRNLTKYVSIEKGYLIVGDDGRIIDVCSTLPTQYEAYPRKKYGRSLIIPAFCDIHLHSAQWMNTGLGYNIPFEDWMEKYTYPAEQQYHDPEKAEQINRRLLRELWKYGTMHAVIMGSTDAPSIYNLMELYSRSGMCAYIGKMNADVAGFGNLAECTDTSIEDTIMLIEKANHLSNHISYCISPEFIPNCSDELMKRLGELAVRYHLPVQSHMSEAESDVQIVNERYQGRSYAQVYHSNQLFGQTPSVMAHCIYATAEERALMKENKVTLAHCPVAISNIPAGKPMALRTFLEDGVNVGLGSDIGGGHTLNMMRIIENTVHYSKFQHFIDFSRPLSILEAFALATVGGGKVFGKTGSFQPGYTFDALIIEDEDLSPTSSGYSIEERVERILYEGDYNYIKERYCHGRNIEEPFVEF